MLLVIGAIIGINLCLRIVLGELGELRARGTTGMRGKTRLKLADYAFMARRGFLFLVIPIAIGLLLDVWLGTTIPELGQSLQGADVE